MAERNSRKRSVPARLREGKVKRESCGYESIHARAVLLQLSLASLKIYAYYSSKIEAMSNQ